MGRAIKLTTRILDRPFPPFPGFLDGFEPLFLVSDAQRGSRSAWRPATVAGRRCRSA
jgi:hypothetical protein